MAEFCLEGWNLLNESTLTEDDVILSIDSTYCEHCGEFKKVVIREK